MAFFAVTFCSAYGTQQKENNHILWYDEPAATWTEALPIGNSRLGAMIFGSPSADRLQLNEETIWPGGFGISAESAPARMGRQV